MYVLAFPFQTASAATVRGDDHSFDRADTPSATCLSPCHPAWCFVRQLSPSTSFCSLDSVSSSEIYQRGLPSIEHPSSSPLDRNLAFGAQRRVSFAALRRTEVIPKRQAFPDISRVLLIVTPTRLLSASLTTDASRTSFPGKEELARTPFPNKELSVLCFPPLV